LHFAEQIAKRVKSGTSHKLFLVLPQVVALAIVPVYTITLPLSLQGHCNLLFSSLGEKKANSESCYTTK
jgi:hypothetical protein